MVLGFSLPGFAKSMTFYVEMACGNCSAAITQSIEDKYEGKYTALDVDFEADTVTIESASLSEKKVIKAIKDAGFEVSDTPIESEEKK